MSHPSVGNMVTDKWVWSHKRKADGSLDRYKAWWLLMDFTRHLGVDCDENFNPVVKPTNFHVVLFLSRGLGPIN